MKEGAYASMLLTECRLQRRHREKRQVKTVDSYQVSHLHMLHWHSSACTAGQAGLGCYEHKRT